MLYSDTTAGCFGDTAKINRFSQFLNTDGYVTDGASSSPLSGIRQIAASTYAGGLLLLRDLYAGTTLVKGVVTFQINVGPGGNLVDVNNNVIDPLSGDPSTPGSQSPLQGAVQVGQGLSLSCALMGPGYAHPNAVVCFSVRDAYSAFAYLGLSIALPLSAYPFGPSVIALDASTLISGTSLSVGLSHACVTVSSRQVLCFGNNNYGQLAGTVASSSDIVLTPTQISSSFHTFAIMTTFPSSTVLARLAVHQVACGAYHTCILLTDKLDGAGVVRCWGWDGTSGDSAPSVYHLEQNVLYSGGLLSGKPLTGVTSVSTGSFVTCVTLGAEQAVTCEYCVSCLGSSGTLCGS